MNKKQLQVFRRLVTRNGGRVRRSRLSVFAEIEHIPADVAPPLYEILAKNGFEEVPGTQPVQAGFCRVTQWQPTWDNFWKRPAQELGELEALYAQRPME